ncbi:DUF4270 domain-containing protein [Winogradskyella alexanderae]|uniref:DUF4270 domain-containing protein n=1 Tax=Winogradskyella alexanderae TaxID=2877123 RepID=A0ABS7XPY9_9FLAO|nr:DUF4270 domain-containing protein [Winogradskyella alexanderae]MCA0131454.1 DUF4270 domain-containing protein [Winogradskyella alexanderae]
MKNTKIALNLLTLSFLLLSFIACDKDFATIDSDVLSPDTATDFNIKKDSFDIITYTKRLGPMQSDGLNVNLLGIYDDAYGRTTASFVSQITTSTFSPTFGTNVVLDSVALYIPFFSRATDFDDDGELIYTNDSVFGDKPFKLSIFESNYFLRDFVPDGEFNETVAYFSNKTLDDSSTIPESLLEGTPIEYLNEDGTVNTENIVTISNKAIILTTPDTDEDEDEDPQVVQTLTPGLRLMLKPEFWQEKIINQEGESVLSSQNNLSEYFRGLYFKAEPIDDEGSFLILNIGTAVTNITLYYTRDDETADDDDEVQTVQETYQLSFGPTRVNFLQNDFNFAIDDGDDTNGDSRLYLKGGDGAIARIKLFNGTDIDDDNDTFNAFEIWKNDFVETDEEGNFVKSKRLVNEANLIFHVDQNIVNGNEPNRIYLYDIENKIPLVDYFLDGIVNAIPSISVLNHLGPLQRIDDEPEGDGIKYKLEITEHINNLLLRDSTNVDLGLSVSLNVNLEENFPQREIISQEENLTSPLSSVLSPRGTVLHGNNTEDETKKVYLEIYYTEPNN